jgi:hypothetical protein
MIAARLFDLSQARTLSLSLFRELSLALGLSFARCPSLSLSRSLSVVWAVVEQQRAQPVGQVSPGQPRYNRK